MGIGGYTGYCLSNFLYMNYNPEDPNFSYDENNVKFSLLPPSKKSTDTD